jgi:hypothetical protein
VEILEAEQNIDDGENFGGNDEGNSEMQVWIKYLLLLLLFMMLIIELLL